MSQIELEDDHNDDLNLTAKQQIGRFRDTDFKYIHPLISFIIHESQLGFVMIHTYPIL